MLRRPDTRVVVISRMGSPGANSSQRPAVRLVGIDGVTKNTEILRLPHRGQRSRSETLSIGKSRPRVATRVVMSRLYFQSHLRLLLPVSTRP